MRATCSQVISSKWQEQRLKASGLYDSTGHTLLKPAMARTGQDNGTSYMFLPGSYLGQMHITSVQGGRQVSSKDDALIEWEKSPRRT